MKRITLLSMVCLLALAGGLWAQWIENGVPVSVAVQDQNNARITRDGFGGTIVVWQDKRSGNLDIYAQRMSNWGVPQWTQNGVAICTSIRTQQNPQIISVGGGGAIIVWEDSLNGNWDIFAQKVDAGGNVQWPTNGVPVCDNATNSQKSPSLVTDGSGGAIITWTDYRGDYDIYAQRVNASGIRTWNTHSGADSLNGLVICNASAFQRSAGIVQSGDGGAIISWIDGRALPSDIYAQRVDANGTVLWTSNGVAITDSLAVSTYGNLGITTDGASGAIVAWNDIINGSSNFDIYAQRVDSSGGLPWPGNGTPICEATGNQTGECIVSDGAGGAIIAWYDYRSGGSTDIYAQRIDAAGTVGWTQNGVAVCTEVGSQNLPTIAADGTNGAIITWYDYRNSENVNIYAQRIEGNGAALWTTNGVSLTSAWGEQLYPQIESDGAGGAVVSWEDKRTGYRDVYAQRVRADGNVGSPLPPQLVSPADNDAISSTNPTLTWNRTSDTNTFRLQMAYDSLFAACLADTLVADDTTCQVSLPDPDSVFHWRVRAYLPGFADSSAWSVAWRFRLDTQPPGSPPNLRANGQNPSPWTPDQSFAITLDTLGLDPSGFGAALWKLGARPTGDSDTTGSSASASFMAAASAQAGESLFVWIRDGAGNASYLNWAQVSLRWDTIPPTAAVHRPNGAEAWNAGSLESISWGHGDNGKIGDDSLYYSPNAGADWTPIARLYPPDTIYSWQVPSTPSDSCLVKLVVRDSADNRGVDVSDSYFTINPPFVTTLAISFTTWNPPPLGKDTILFVFNSAGAETIGFTASADSIWIWPSPLQDSTPCNIMIHAEPNYSGNLRLGHIILEAPGVNGSPQVLTLTQASLDTFSPGVNLLTPQGGEAYLCGQQTTIAWNDSDNVSVTVDSIYLSTDNQASWTPVAGLPQSSSYLWDVPHSPTLNGYIKIVAIDQAGNRGWAANSSAFSILDTIRPTVSLKTPNGGENLIGGTAYEITWSHGDNVGVAVDSLHFTSDEGASWLFITSLTTGDTSYLWTVPSTPSNNCRVRIGARDASGNKAEDMSLNYFTIVDAQLPRLHCVLADTSRMSYGSDFTFRVYANDNIGIAKVRLYWRPGGSAAAPDSAQMYNFPPDTQYVYPLPASQIPLQGLSYRLAVWDSAGNSVSYPASGYKLHSVYLSQLAMSQAYASDKWKMVSFPARIDQAQVAGLLTDDLGAYDIYKWRLYEYQADHYVEHGDATFRPGATGRAYWLRQKVGPAIILDADNVSTATSADSTVAIPLVSQWTDLGNPFLFPVNWADVRVATGADTSKILGIYTYSGDGWVFPVTGLMAPWEGYCLRVSSAGTLRVPMKAAKAGGPKEVGWPEGWRGTVAVSGGGKRDDNYFGIGSGASIGLDRWDYPEPPSGLTKISGWFEVEGQACGSDLRPSLGEGQSWGFSASGSEGDLAVTVELPSDVLKSGKCYWADLAEGMYEEVIPGFSYRYRTGSALEKRDFRLILGSQEYAQAELDKALTAPGATALLQNRPNPFGASTEIRYHLAAPGRARVTVYNVIGQAVRALVDGEKRAGRYRAVWDGRDDAGRKVGAGVYLCRLEAGGSTATRRMTLLR